MTPVSHAFVLPDANFHQWLEALRPYLQQFERVAVVRSPRGNDLNRYRNVTAVTAPLTWFQDDPHTHIRRIYPMVVRVDIVRASTPQQMAQILARRIQRDDRYGEQDNVPVHLYDRFILEYPTHHRPMRILNRFAGVPNPQTPDFGLDFLTIAGAPVLASAGGRVTRQWMSAQSDALNLGNYVQVTSIHEGQNYVVTYSGLSEISVPLHAQVRVGDVLGKAQGGRMKLVVQTPPTGIFGYRLPNIADPTRMMYLQGLRVRPTGRNLRVRTLPSTDGDIITTVQMWDMLESMEMHGRTLTKMGQQDEWLRVKLPDGRTGYTAAWFLEAVLRHDSAWVGVNPVGVNLDAMHPLGTPEASRLGNLGWVRFGYNVSANVGSEDINAAFNRYAPLAERYQRAGYKVCFTTSHQTYGEGKRHYWPWADMTDEKWRELSDRFAEMMGRISAQYAGRGLVDCWQIWNEQDAYIGAQASTPMQAHNYTYMMRQSLPAIRASDANVTIITGGHTGGPGRGSDYARASINALPSNLRPDGVAFHPYGRSHQPGVPYGIFGHIDESMQAYGAIMPDKPLWITEWGVLDRNQDNPADIANYALGMVQYLKGRYPGRIASLIWYAWAEGMHNGYGLVDRHLQPRPPLTEGFLNA